MKLIGTVEDFPDGVDFKECRAATFGKTTAKICYLVVHIEIALLTKHAQSSHELLLTADLLVLGNRYHTIAQRQPALHFLLVAHGKYGVGTAESRQICLLYTSDAADE